MDGLTRRMDRFASRSFMKATPSTTSSGLVRMLPIFLFGLTGGAAAAATISDDFSGSHDYSGKNVAGTIWDGVMINDGFSGTQNTTVGAANSNTSNAGRLTLTTANGDWGGSTADGFFLYLTVSGDFTATIDLVSASVVNYHDLGLMARAADEADGGAGEDYVAGRYFAAGGSNNLRSVDSDVETNYDAAGLRSYLSLSRSGNVFTYVRASDSGFTTGVVTSSVTRDDLDGLPLQVGIWQATFTGSQATAVFDNFTLTTVPEPSVIGLGGMGALVLLRRRRA